MFLLFSGVDDILPIMTYVIIRSGMPQLFTECAIMKEFIQERYVHVHGVSMPLSLSLSLSLSLPSSYMMGEEGFCLTTFDTALRYVAAMSS